MKPAAKTKEPPKAPRQATPVNAGTTIEAPARSEAGQGAASPRGKRGRPDIEVSIAMARRYGEAAVDDWRKGLEEDEEFAKDCEASITEVRPYHPDLVQFPPDLQMRVRLALGRVEDDACWATARKHPKFSRLYTLASIGSMCLDYAAGALEYLNAGPLTEKGKRKFDRAVSKAERMAQEIEQSGELKALLAKRRANLDKATLAREEDAQALAERVAELDRENPAYSHVEMAKKLAAEGIHHKKNRKPYTARRIGQIRNKQ